MPQQTPYLDSLLQLVLRVFGAGSFLGNVGGGTSGINVNAPLTATPNQATQNVDLGLGPNVTVSTLAFTPGTASATPGSGSTEYADQADGGRIKAINNLGIVSYLGNYADGTTIYTGTFTAVMNTINIFNFGTNTGVINFPAAGVAMGGQSCAFINIGTNGSNTTNILTSQGTAKIVGANGQTSNGFAPSASSRATYSFEINSWIPGI